MVANSQSTDDLHSLLIVFLGVQLDVVGNDEHRRPFAQERIKPKVAHAAGHDQPDIAALDVVGLDGLGHRLAEFGGGHRDFHPDRLGGFVEPADVSFELEYLSIIYPDPFEDSVPVQQSVIEHGYLRILAIDQFSIQPDLRHDHSP